MTKIDILSPCPCDSGVNYENCCQPHHLGSETPDTAEKLLRARYTAYVVGQTDYVVETHHPEKAKELDKEGVEEWSESSTWQGLEILNVDDSKAKEGETAIEFIVRYTQDGSSYAHQETSIFKKEAEKWFFYDVKKNVPIKKDNKVGRNDPCPCGSGKKFKKCCG